MTMDDSSSREEGEYKSWDMEFHDILSCVVFSEDLLKVPAREKN
jgi:hypothetical protein